MRSWRVAQTSKSRRGLGLLALAIIVALVILLIPGVAAASGSLIGGLWVSVMGAVMGLLGGLIS
jgi:hypothetical protein